MTLGTSPDHSKQLLILLSKRVGLLFLFTGSIKCCPLRLSRPSPRTLKILLLVPEM